MLSLILNKKKAEVENARQIEDLSLEEILEIISQFGRTSLFEHEDKTWSCKVNMFVTGEGVNFEIKSGFDPKSPKEAALICLRRIKETLEDLSKACKV